MQVGNDVCNDVLEFGHGQLSKSNPKRVLNVFDKQYILQTSPYKSEAGLLRPSPHLWIGYPHFALREFKYKMKTAWLIGNHSSTDKVLLPCTNGLLGTNAYGVEHRKASQGLCADVCTPRTSHHLGSQREASNIWIRSLPSCCSSAHTLAI